MIMIELQHALVTYKEGSANELVDINFSIHNYFTFLVQYLDIFGDDCKDEHQVILSRLTAEMMQRIESDLTSLVAIISSVQSFTHYDLIIKATSKFLATWLECDSR